MIKIPQSKDEFIMMAMRAYDPTCISMKEFKQDIRIVKKIKKDIRSLGSNEFVNLRYLLNQFLIAYNQFQEAATSLIFYEMSDDDISLACHFIIKLGRRDFLVDSVQINTDEKLLEELLKI